MSEELDALVNLDDFERLAPARLPAGVRGYYEGGAEDEWTLAANRRAWSDWPLQPRVLRDIAARSTATAVLGQRLGWPLLIAPTACHALAHPEAELATARAAAATGTPLVLSTLSNRPMEEVAREARAGCWFQLYVYRDRGVTRELVRRAQAAGCSAIVLTVDTPIPGRRERDRRTAFTLPDGLPFANLSAAGQAFATAGHGTGEGSLVGYLERMFDASLGWRDLEWLIAESALPVLVKGVMRPDDAVHAQRIGARGVIVSNHGGRQLDGAAPTAQVLPGIADALGARETSRFALLVDGGIRRGVDIVRALALGADAVLLGRPVLWGLTLGGEAGVRRVLELLREEFSVAMALSGCKWVAEISRELLAPRR